MVACCADKCKNRSELGFVLVRFPKDEVRRSKWIEAAIKSGRSPSLNSRLCEVHFERDQWEKFRCRLKPTAVPTLFCDCDDKQSSSKVKCALQNKGCRKNVEIQRPKENHCGSISASRSLLISNQPGQKNEGETALKIDEPPKCGKNSCWAGYLKIATNSSTVTSPEPKLEYLSAEEEVINTMEVETDNSLISPEVPSSESHAAVTDDTQTASETTKRSVPLKALIPKVEIKSRAPLRKLRPAPSPLPILRPATLLTSSLKPTNFAIREVPAVRLVAIQKTPINQRVVPVRSVPYHPSQRPIHHQIQRQQIPVMGNAVVKNLGTSVARTVHLVPAQPAVRVVCKPEKRNVSEELNRLLPRMCVSYEDNFGIHILFLSSDICKAVQRSVVVPLSGGHIEFFVHGEEMAEKLPEKILNVRPCSENVDAFIKAVLNIVITALSFGVCCGADDPRCVGEWNGAVNCEVDKNVFREPRYRETLRTKECCLLIPQSDRRCEACNKLQRCLRSRVVRRNGEGEPTES